MSKNKHYARKKIAHTLMSVFVLSVFIIPTFLTGRWLVGALTTHDPRGLKPVIGFSIRTADTVKTKITPFDQPLVSVTFDDGWESVYTQAFPILQREGIHTTQYIITGTFENYLYMSIAQIKAMHNAGNEVAAHTISHADLTTLDDSQLTHELVGSQDAITKDFGPTKEFTSPYGAYNAHTLQMIGKYYRSQKNTEGDPAANELEAINIKDGFSQLNFKSYSVRKTTTLADIKKLMKAAEDNNGWLVLTYHQIDYSGETFSVTPDVFNEQMALVSNSHMRAPTVGQVFDILNPTPTGVAK